MSQHVIFKGGTSLSKCYGLIERFSEDIDLTLSKKYIGITDAVDPVIASGSKQRSKRLNEFAKKVKAKIDNEIAPFLLELFRKILANYFDDNEWRLEFDEMDKDKQTLVFHYPSCLEKKPDEYVQSSVKLEFGARGDISPFEITMIFPYVQKVLPELFDAPPVIKVASLVAKRTFWEKITLLHAEYHRDETKPIPNRLFRHYYDVVLLDQKNITGEALHDIQLLSDVVLNKEIYFPSQWANYGQAKIGSLKIYPNEAFIEALKQDHAKMKEMFFGNPPDFQSVMEEIKKIKVVINS